MKQSETTSKRTKTPKEYLGDPYARVLIPDEETRTYTAHIPEFPGCISQGNSAEEALARLEDAAESWIRACLERNQPIPAPRMTQEYSGKIVLRLPRTLHKQAAELAEVEGVSLNQLLVSAIAERIGRTKAIQQRQVELGIQKFEEPNSLTVNAAEVNPAKESKKSKTK